MPLKDLQKAHSSKSIEGWDIGALKGLSHSIFVDDTTFGPHGSMTNCVNFLTILIDFCISLRNVIMDNTCLPLGSWNNKQELMDLLEQGIA